MIGRNANRRRLAVAVAATVIAVVLACSERAAGPTTERTRRVTLSPVLAARIESERRTYGALIAVHNLAMDDLRQHPERWFGNESDRKERVCRALYRLTRHYARIIHAQMNEELSESDADAEASAAVANVKRCAPAGRASIFSSLLAPRAIVALAPQSDDEVTEAYINYLNSLPGVVLQTDGSPEATNSAVVGVLNSASSLSTADFDVVAGGGDFAYSSSNEWYPVYGSGTSWCYSADSSCDPQPVMNVFRRSQQGGGGGSATAFIVYQDMLGCAAGVASAYSAGERNGWRLLGQCVIWGAAASGGASLGLKMMK